MIEIKEYKKTYIAFTPNHEIINRFTDILQKEYGLHNITDIHCYIENDKEVLDVIGVEVEDEE